MVGSEHPVSSRQHWESAWSAGPHELRGWYQDEPQPSLDLVAAHTPHGGHVVDVGGGASLLVDRLVARGYDVTVVDLAEAPLALARNRLGDLAEQVSWVRADATELDLGVQVDTWHDRAVLHFLLDDEARRAYAERLVAHLRPGGHAVIGTFAPDGPERCSGLPVRRHTAEQIADLLAPSLELIEERREVHRTPGGGEQTFTFAVIRASSVPRSSPEKR